MAIVLARAPSPPLPHTREARRCSFAHFAEPLSLSASFRFVPNSNWLQVRLPYKPREIGIQLSCNWDRFEFRSATSSNPEVVVPPLQ